MRRFLQQNLTYPIPILLSLLVLTIPSSTRIQQPRMMGSFIGYFGQEIREEMRLQLTALRDQVANDFNSTDK